MIQRLNITKWVYWISIVLFINTLISLLTFVFPNEEVFFWPVGIVIYSIFISPLLIFLLFIDWLRDRYSNYKICVISLIINLGIIILAYYYGNTAVNSLIG